MRDMQIRLCRRRLYHRTQPDIYVRSIRPVVKKAALVLNNCASAAIHQIEDLRTSDHSPAGCSLEADAGVFPSVD